MARIVNGIIVPETETAASGESGQSYSLNLFGKPISLTVFCLILLFTILFLGLRGIFIIAIVFAASYFIQQRSTGNSGQYSSLATSDDNSRRRPNIKGIGDLPKKAAGC